MIFFLPKKDSQRQGDPSNNDPRHEPVEVGLNLITKIFCSEVEILETISKKVLFPLNIFVTKILTYHEHKMCESIVCKQH
jgi:hypothetical protein